MKNDDIELLLRETAGPSAPQPSCPSDVDFASFTEGGLGDRDHRDLIEHIAGCAFCQERLGILGRARDADSVAKVPQFVMASARRLVPAQKPARSERTQAPRWAAAAMAVLAVGLFLRPDSGDIPVAVENEPANNPASLQPIRETRSIVPFESGPVLTVPRDGMTVLTGGRPFSWVGVPDALWYDLRIVSDEGDLVWQERVPGTHWTPPPELSLTPGAEYFVRVGAHLAPSKTIQSDYVLFRIVDSP